MCRIYKTEKRFRGAEKSILNLFHYSTRGGRWSNERRWKERREQGYWIKQKIELKEREDRMVREVLREGKIWLGVAERVEKEGG